jgi:hypothetical protein
MACRRNAPLGVVSKLGMPRELKKSLGCANLLGAQVRPPRASSAASTFLAPCRTLVPI